DSRIFTALRTPSAGFLLCNTLPMKVSVVIPCYNERDTIAEIVSAVRTAPLPDIEIIVVDDGSTDGSRTILKRNVEPIADRVVYFWHMVGNKLLTLFSNMCTNVNLTDMETCYKAFRGSVLRNIDLREDRFGFEPEITAKVARARCRIYEVGISYDGRTYEE